MASDSGSSALARRIDYELLRALEWRDGRLEPLSSDEGTPPRGETGSAADLVAWRARALLARDGRTPGERASDLLGVLTTVLLVVAMLAGWQLARLALGDPARGPVNLVLFLGQALGLQTLLLLLSLVALALLHLGLGRILAGWASLGALVLGGAMRLVTRFGPLAAALASGREAGPVARQALSRLRDLVALRPLVLSASHGAWAAFNLAFLLAASLSLTAQHHVFAWQSTFVTDPALAERGLGILTAPAAVWPGRPSAEQVRVSRFDPEADGFVDDGGDAERARRLRQAWATPLLASVAGWGLVPRVLLLLVCLLLWRRARRLLGPSADDPYVKALLARLDAGLSTRHEGRPAPAREPPDASEAACPDTACEGPRAWYAASYLAAAPAADPVAAIWGRRLEGWSDLPRLDSRRAEKAALETLAQGEAGPRGLVLLCDYAVTPDAALGRLLDGLRRALGAEGLLAVVLTGGEAFRTSRRGRPAGAVAERRRLWLEALGRHGISQDFVVDVDPDRATPAVRLVLARRLGVHVPELVATTAAAADLDSALDALLGATPGWLAAAERAAPARREPLALQQAAEARLLVDRAFGRGAEIPDAGPPLPGFAAVQALLGRSFELPAGFEARALPAAARSLHQMGRWIGRLERLDPRLVLAGLTLGLVAGPLGGALAAGTAGLVAGASLSTTLGAIGAALGGAFSLGRGRAVADQEGDGESSDALGLPLRTGVLHALVLAHQEQGEPAVVAALERLAGATEASRPLETVEQARAFLAAARCLGVVS